MFTKISLLTNLYSIVAIVVDGTTTDIWDDNYYCRREFNCLTSKYHSNINILCGNQLNSNRHPDIKYVPINDEIKEAFLKGHNEKRSLTAEGKVKPFLGKTATRMATLVWDDELELFAIASAIEGEMEEISCIKSERYPSPGVNSYKLDIRESEQSFIIAVNKTINAWFDTNEYAKDLNLMKSYSADWYNISKFTQIIWGDTVAIGCSIPKEMSQICIFCVYSGGNVNWIPVYEVGSMGSQCKKGLNPTYPGLCNVNEYFVANITNRTAVLEKWMNSNKLNISTWNFGTAHKSGVTHKFVDFSFQIVILAVNFVIAKIFIFLTYVAAILLK